MASRNRRPPARSLTRKAGTRTPRKTVVVFCEGERTEPEYLRALKMLPSVRDIAAVDLRVEAKSSGSLPRALVSLAMEARRRAYEEDDEIDEFWCVFDVEWPRNHPGLMDAVAQADRHGIRLAISNPCFELWLALHFANHNSWLDNDEACRIRRRLDGSSGKGLDSAKHMPCLAEAMLRAVNLDKRHERDGTVFPHNNPSSGMHLLLSSLQIAPLGGAGAPTASARKPQAGQPGR